MLSIYKIILGFVVFILTKHYWETQKVVGCIICLLILIYIIFDLYQRLRILMDGQFLSINNNVFSTSTEKESDFYPDTQVSWDNTYSHIVKNNIDEIEKRIRISKNFIAFCDEKIIKEQPKNIQATKTIALTTKSNMNNSSIETFTICNSDAHNDVKELVYKTILKVLNKQTLKPNEKYALLQSFYYIHITPTIISFYIDKEILQKGGLSEFNLCKTSIKQELCDALRYPKLEVKFIPMKNITLLTYYLNHQQNGN